MSIINAIDSYLSSFFDKISNPLLDSIMVFLTQLGDGGVFWIAVILILIAIPKCRRLGLLCAFSLILCFLTGNYLIKPIVGRIRPCNIETEISMLISRPVDYSFPSMHTATAFSVSTLIYKRYSLLGIGMILLSVAIALSRVYLNVHYTTDIIAGAVYGSLCAFVAKIVIKKTKLISGIY